MCCELETKPQELSFERKQYFLLSNTNSKQTERFFNLQLYALFVCWWGIIKKLSFLLRLILKLAAKKHHNLLKTWPYTYGTYTCLRITREREKTFWDSNVDLV